MNESLDGASILEGIMEIFHQDGEKATDLEVCYQMLDYLKKCLEA
jgi:hypothetical protein